MLTLDIDGIDRAHATTKMLMAYFNLKYIYPKAKISVRITKHGYHIIAYGINVSFEKELMLRAMLGDDKRRIAIDDYKKSIGSHNLGVLWTYKRGFETREIKVI